MKYTYVEPKDDWPIGPAGREKGAKVALTFAIQSKKTTQSVFEKYTRDYAFSQLSPRLVSRHHAPARGHSVALGS